jgi:hypothetical protein
MDGEVASDQTDAQVTKNRNTNRRGARVRNIRSDNSNDDDDADHMRRHDWRARVIMSNTWATPTRRGSSGKRPDIGIGFLAAAVVVVVVGIGTSSREASSTATCRRTDNTLDHWRR